MEIILNTAGLGMIAMGALLIFCGISQFSESMKYQEKQRRKSALFIIAFACACLITGLIFVNDARKIENASSVSINVNEEDNNND